MSLLSDDSMAFSPLRSVVDRIDRSAAILRQLTVYATASRFRGG